MKISLLLVVILAVLDISQRVSGRSLKEALSGLQENSGALHNVAGRHERSLEGDGSKVAPDDAGDSTKAGKLRGGRGGGGGRGGSRGTGKGIGRRGKGKDKDGKEKRIGEYNDGKGKGDSRQWKGNGNGINRNKGNSQRTTTRRTGS